MSTSFLRPLCHRTGTRTDWEKVPSGWTLAALANTQLAQAWAAYPTTITTQRALITPGPRPPWLLCVTEARPEMIRANSVAKSSRTAPIWLSTGVHTLERSPTIVPCVHMRAPRAPSSHVIWRPMVAGARMCTTASFATCRSLCRAPWRSTCVNV